MCVPCCVLAPSALRRVKEINGLKPTRVFVLHIYAWRSHALELEGPCRVWGMSVKSTQLSRPFLPKLEAAVWVALLVAR